MLKVVVVVVVVVVTVPGMVIRSFVLCLSVCVCVCTCVCVSFSVSKYANFCCCCCCCCSFLLLYFYNVCSFVYITQANNCILVSLFISLASMVAVTFSILFRNIVSPTKWEFKKKLFMTIASLHYYTKNLIKKTPFEITIFNSCIYLLTHLTSSS